MSIAVDSVPPHVPLTAVLRNGVVESVHAGSVAVVDRSGRVLHAAGDPQRLTFTRSSLKPLQALPFVAAGGPGRFGLSPAHVAVVCASHSGEARHVEAVREILHRAGCSPDELQCGSHVPGFYEAQGLFPSPPPYSPLEHNCSGKHSGMLAYCAMCGHSRHDYLAFEHPLQESIRNAVADYTGQAAATLPGGIDGCSAPNYAVPLSALALAFARIASPEPHPTYGRAAATVYEAMTAHPGMVSGEKRSDDALMRAGRGDWVTKIGAEGVQAIGVRSHGIGIAIKVDDGQKRGLYPAIVAVLDALGLLDAGARELLAPWANPEVRNYRGLHTGEVRPVVALRSLP